MQKKLTGISISGQASLKTLAFADDCVLGLSSNQDATIANDLISKYESVSQAKLIADKSHAISKGLGPPVLFRGIKYSTTPIRHLKIHVNSTGICTELMEDKIATKISSQIAHWSLVNPTIHGKCLLINTFLTSKIWYFRLNSWTATRLRSRFDSSPLDDHIYSVYQTAERYGHGTI